MRNDAASPRHVPGTAPSQTPRVSPRAQRHDAFILFTMSNSDEATMNAARIHPVARASHDRIKGLTNRLLYIMGCSDIGPRARRPKGLRTLPPNAPPAHSVRPWRTGRVVEANGIEPMTSGLQSRRSPS